jgi:hypothetical protein
MKQAQRTGWAVYEEGKGAHKKKLNSHDSKKIELDSIEPH